MIICNRCGKENQDHYKFCLGCGAELTNATPKPQPPSGDVGMMKTVMADVGPSHTPPGGVGAGGLPGVPGSGAPSGSYATPRPSGPFNAPKGPPLGLGPPPGVPAANMRGHGSGAHATPRPAPGAPNAWNRGDQSSPVPRPGPGVPSGPNMGPGMGRTPGPDFGGRTPGPVPVPQQPASGPRTCGSCGAVVPAAFKFCGVCGSKMEEMGVPDTVRASGMPARARMTLIRPDGSEGGVHTLAEGDNKIGRDHGELFENDGYLSPTHASLVVTGNRAVIRDLGSLNGVFVKMTQEEELRPGQVLRIGQELLRFDSIVPPEPLEDGTEVMGSPNPGYWGKITVIIGNGVDGSAYPLLGDSVTLGRERGEINFPEDGYVSGLHARVTNRDGRVFLTDLNSSNGTFIKVPTERTLGDDSFILLGQQLFRLNLG